MADRQSRTFFGIYINGQQADKTLKELRSESRMLKNELANLKPGSEAYIAKMKELRQVEPLIQKHNDQVKGLNGVWSKVKTEVKAFGAVALAALGAQAIFNGLDRLIKRMGDISDIMADVQRTTGMTKMEVERLNSELGDINTRSSRKELLELSKEAGKLGITGVANVRKFVEEADQINVALGEDLGEGAIISIGKLANIFKTDMLNIGSALNEVGAAGIASESWQVDFLNRLAGVAETAQLSLPDLLSYCATLESLGQTAEVSGTALSKMFLKLIRDTGEFEKIAGFANGELSKLIGEQGTSAGFVAFINKLKESSVNTADLAQRLDKLGIDGVRSAGVLLSLANNTEMVAEQFEIANKGFIEGTSITKEFETRMQTFGAAVDLLRKRLMSAFMNNPITRGIQNMIIGISELVNKTETATEKITAEAIELNKLVMRITDVNAKNEDRIALIEQLKKDYPELTNMVNLDTASNEQLLSVLQKVNDQYGKKIVLAKRGEALADQEQRLSEIEAEKIEAELALEEFIARFQFLSGITKASNESAFDFVERLKETYGTGVTGVIKSSNKELVQLFTDIQIYSRTLPQLQKQYNNELEATLELENELQALQIKLLGNQSPDGPVKPDFIGDNSFGGDTAGGTSSSTESTSSQQETELEKIKKQLAAIKEEAEDLSSTAFFAKYEGNNFDRLAYHLAKDTANLREETQLLYDLSMDETDEYWANMAREAAATEQKIDAMERLLELKAMEGMAIRENAETQEEATKQILNNLRQEVKAILAKTIAQMIANILLKTGTGNIAGMIKEAAKLALLGTVSSLVGSLVASAFDKAIPAFAEGGPTSVVSAANGRSYNANPDGNFAGGYVSSPLLVGEEGMEYAVPSWMMQVPQVIDTVGLLESIRQSGPGGVNAPGSIHQDQRNMSTVNNYNGIDQAMAVRLVLLLERLEKNGVYANIGDRQIRKMAERQELLNEIESRSRF